MGEKGRKRGSSEFDFFFLLIEKMEFRHVVVGIRLNLDRLFVFPAPFGFFAEEKASFG